MVREKSNAILIYLTAMDQEIDIVNGYDTGADDYITKPFSVNILTSKVNAFMRRLGNNEEGIYVSGDIEVYVNDMQVKKAGELIPLSKTELQLLLFLLYCSNQYISLSSDGRLQMFLLSFLKCLDSSYRRNM